MPPENHSEHEVPPAAPRQSGAIALLVNVVYAALASLAMILLYDQVIRPAHPNLAVVDVLSIMDKEDAEAIRAIKGGDVEAARAASERRAKRGARLEKMIEQVASERGLVIVQKQAVLGGALPDLTAEVEKLLEE